MECRVRKLRIRAGRGAPVSHVVQCLENTLRTASFPGMNSSALIVVRSISLRLGTAPMSFFSGSRLVDSMVANLALQAVPAWTSGAALAPAVWFRDTLEAPALLALRLVVSHRADEWFWRGAIVGWCDDFEYPSGLPLVVKAAARLQPSRAAVARLVTTLMDAGRLDSLLETLHKADGEELLTHFGLPKETATCNPPWGTGQVRSVVSRLHDRWGRLLVRWAARWGDEDPRTLWLAAVALWLHGPIQMENTLHCACGASAVTQSLPETSRQRFQNPVGCDDPLAFSAMPPWDPLEVWDTGSVVVPLPRSISKVNRAPEDQTTDAVSLKSEGAEAFRHRGAGEKWRELNEADLRFTSESMRTLEKTIPPRSGAVPQGGKAPQQRSAQNTPGSSLPQGKSVHPRKTDPPPLDTKAEMGPEAMVQESGHGERSVPGTWVIGDSSKRPRSLNDEELEDAPKKTALPLEKPLLSSKTRIDMTAGATTVQRVGSARESRIMPQRVRNPRSLPRGPSLLAADNSRADRAQPFAAPLFLDAQWSFVSGFLFLLGLFRSLSFEELFCRHPCFAAMVAGVRFLEYMGRLLPLPEGDPHHRVLSWDRPLDEKKSVDKPFNHFSTLSSAAFSDLQSRFRGQTPAFLVSPGTQHVPLFEPPASWRRLLAERPQTQRRLGLRIVQPRQGLRLLVDRTERLVFGVSTSHGKTFDSTGSAPWVQAPVQDGLQDRILLGLFKAARLVTSLFLWRREGLTFQGLARRPGRMVVGPTHVDVFFRLDQTDVRIRRLGLDVTPGWVPWLSRVITFHYGD